MAKKFDGRQRKIFLYSCNFTMQEKDMLEKKIQKLGGISYTMEDMYVSESTHVIVPDTWARKWTSVIMGAVGSGLILFLRSTFSLLILFRNRKTFFNRCLILLKKCFDCIF